jgi:GMP synthase (glutamine-hydrolysing)
MPDEMKGEMGSYAKMFATLLSGNGFDYVDYFVVDGVFPDTIDAADGWLITGSKHGVYEDHDWIAPLEQLIRDIVAAGKPLIGICFGHQIIAQALGGRVEKFSGGWSAGPTTYQVNDREMVLNAWHQDQVITPPEGARVFASSDFCANAGLVIGDSVLTIQPHPEFNARMIDGLVRYRAQGLLPPEMIEDINANLNARLDDQDFARMMADFFLAAPHPKTAKTPPSDHAPHTGDIA